MKLVSQRIFETELSCISELKVDGYHHCWILEPPKSKWRMPAGIYPLDIYQSPKHRMRVPLLVEQIPDHDYVEIHIGNYPKDTLACLLPGYHRGTDAVYHSSDAFKDLCDMMFPLLEKDEQITIEIKEVENGK